MLSQEFIDQVLESLPPEETRSAGELSETELKQRIDNALTVVVNWLDYRDKPNEETKRLVQQYPMQHFETEYDYGRDYRREHRINHLGGVILNRLLPWLRKKEGEVEFGLLGPNDEDLARSARVSEYIQQNLYANPIVKQSSMVDEFFRILSFVEDGVTSLDELGALFDQVPDQAIVATLTKLDPAILGSFQFADEPYSYDLVRKEKIERMISLWAHRSGSAPLEIATLWANRNSGLHELVKIQFDYIYLAISAERLPKLHAALTALQDVLSADAQTQWYNLDHDVQNNTPEPHQVLCDLNKLLLSHPGTDRTALSERCLEHAQKMTGHANPFWRKIGIALAAVGAAVIALGLSPLIVAGTATLTVALGVGALVTGLGMFVHNRQKGAAALMQTIHDEMQRETQSIFRPQD